MPAADLIKLIEELGAPYGLERSVKILHGVLADDRCLISIHREALGKNPADTLLQIGRELRIPPMFARALPGSLQRADIVHFGYEAGEAGQDVYKIYCEYASDVRRAMVVQDRTPILVHLAYKWTPLRPDGGAVTRYTWVPCRNRIELQQKLSDLIPEGETPTARRFVLALLSRIDAFANSGDLLLMEVEEPGNPRRSCDLNVYDAGLRVSAIAGLLDALMRDFEIPSTEAQAVFGRAGDSYPVEAGLRGNL
jgi:tryptophan halogenase